MINVLIYIFIFFFLFIVIYRAKKVLGKNEIDDKIVINKDNCIDPEFFDESTMIDSEEIDVSNFEELFYEHVNKGEKYQLFMKISSKQDCFMLRSMLASAEIPTYIESEHMNGIYGGFAGTINAVFAIRMFILVNDYDEAYQIVREYMGIKKNTLEQENLKNNNKVSKVTKTIVSLMLAPYPVLKEQEALGMTVFPKNKDSYTYEE